MPINPIYLIMVNTVAIPIVALVDYYSLRGHVEKATGKPVEKWFWLWPCILELVIFNAGISLGIMMGVAN